MSPATSTHRARKYLGTMLVGLCGCSELRCTDKGECRKVDIDELYCPALGAPFDETCTGDPREINAGEVVDLDGRVVLERSRILEHLTGGDADLRAELEPKIFERRSEAVPKQEFDCSESIGAVVDEIGLDVKAAAVRHIEVAVGPLYCVEDEMGPCDAALVAESPYVENMPISPDADAYVQAMLELVDGNARLEELRFVQSTYVGNVKMVLTSENGFAGKVKIPVGETASLGLKVDISEDRRIELSTGSPQGPAGYSLAVVDVPVTEL